MLKQGAACINNHVLFYKCINTKELVLILCVFTKWNKVFLDALSAEFRDAVSVRDVNQCPMTDLIWLETFAGNYDLKVFVSTVVS